MKLTNFILVLILLILIEPKVSLVVKEVLLTLATLTLSVLQVLLT